MNSSFAILSVLLRTFEFRFLRRHLHTLESHRLQFMIPLLKRARHDHLQAGNAYIAAANGPGGSLVEGRAFSASLEVCEALYNECSQHGLTILLPFMQQCAHAHMECSAKGLSFSEQGRTYTSKGCRTPVLSAACFDPSCPEYHSLFYIEHLVPKMAAKLNDVQRRARLSTRRKLWARRGGLLLQRNTRQPRLLFARLCHRGLDETVDLLHQRHPGTTCGLLPASGSQPCREIATGARTGSRSRAQEKFVW
ncbi:hypothetical protein T484DRAFT_1987776 [Baffinella frigidus]|nr:hypothetical protein T484DRAFT_1987776 [Cryptophyta sp. CCMP2293]